MMGSRVRLPDGTTGRVVAEWHQWQDDQGVHHGHRLRVEIAVATCPMCPHQGGVTFRTVDAGDVTVELGA